MSRSEKPPLEKALRLSQSVAIGYGVAEFGINAVEVFLRLHLLVYATETLGLAPERAGWAVACGVLWDALLDPWVGSLSDRSRSRWGRRRPFMLAGALFLVPLLLVLFSWPLGAASNSMRFVFLLGTYALLNTAFAMLSVPHAALAGDLTSDPQERTGLIGWRLLFGNLGAVVGSVVPGFYLGAALLNPEGAFWRTPYARSAAVIAGVTLVATAITAILTREIPGPLNNSQSAKQIKQNPWTTLREAFANTPFRGLFLSYFVATLGLSLNSVLALYYYRQRLLFSETDIQIVLAVFLVVMSFSLPAWVLISRRYGKKKPLLVGITLLGLTGSLLYLVYPPQALSWVLVGSSVVGGVLVGSVVLLDSWLTDVVDWDTVRSRQERSGLYFGLWKTGGKAARALAVGIGGLCLSWVGVHSGQALSREQTTQLAWIFGPGVGSLFVLGAVLASCVGLNSEAQSRIQQILFRRRQRAK